MAKSVGNRGCFSKMTKV